MVFGKLAAIKADPEKNAQFEQAKQFLNARAAVEGGQYRRRVERYKQEKQIIKQEGKERRLLKRIEQTEEQFIAACRGWYNFAKNHVDEFEVDCDLELLHFFLEVVELRWGSQNLGDAIAELIEEWEESEE